MRNSSLFKASGKGPLVRKKLKKRPEIMMDPSPEKIRQDEIQVEGIVSSDRKERGEYECKHGSGIELEEKG